MEFLTSGLNKIRLFTLSQCSFTAPLRKGHCFADVQANRFLASIASLGAKQAGTNISLE
jgi:hypothetical protein